jgi:hypothetical protein
MSPEFKTMQTGRKIEPIVGFPKLDVMTDKPLRPKAIKGKVLAMAAEPKADTGKTNRMSAFKRTAKVVKPKKYEDQKPPERILKKPAAEKEPAGYVRLRLQVKNGDVSVMSAHAVEGPLVDSKLDGALAYEAMVGTKRVAAGAIPDVGEKRSFPAPKGKGAQSGHFVTPLESYEINVRVPKEEVTLKTLPRLEVALYRVKEDLPVVHTAALRRDMELGAQFEKQVREVGRLKGFQPEKHKAVAAQLRKAFK